MLTVDEAFDKFQRRLEITQNEEKSASSRQIKIRSLLNGALPIADDFLTGSYRRETKTKPLRDVDIMIVLSSYDYTEREPASVLADVKDVLEEHYGSSQVVVDRRAVRVEFEVATTDDEVVSFEVVPAVAESDHYLIPDDRLGTWIHTNPKVHAEKATAANKAFSLKWKPLVKMIKKWNQHNDAPVEPGFLIEVMALDLIRGEWTGRYPYEIRQFLATAADRIADGWDDPAGLGPCVSDVLDADPVKMYAARTALADAAAACTTAIRLNTQGKTGEALSQWQNLFGPTFAKS